MRTLISIALLGGLILTAGCYQSLYPIFTEQDIVFEPGLIGVWSEEDSNETWAFSQRESNHYTLVYTDEEGEIGTFIAHLVKVKERLFLDLLPDTEELALKESSFYRLHLRAVHSFMYVKQIEPTLQMSQPDYDWLEDHLSAHPEAVRHADAHGSIILTASPKELQAFWLKHIDTKGAFSDLGNMTRIAKTGSKNDPDKLVFQISDKQLRGRFCSNPVTAEIAAMTDDGDVRIYDMTGQLKQTLRRDGQFIRAVSYSPDGKLLLAGTKAGALLMWDFSAGEWTVIAERVADAVDSVAWLDGTRKVVFGTCIDYYGEGGQELNRDKPSGGVIDRASGEEVWTFKSSNVGLYQSIHTSPDGKKLAVLKIPGQSRGAFILDGSTGQVGETLFHPEYTAGPLSVCIAPDNSTVAVGYGPTDVILWNAEDEKPLKLLKGHGNWVVSLAFSADGRFLISGAGDSSARIWCVDCGNQVGRIKFPGSNAYIWSVGFSPDGTTAFAMARGTLIAVQTPQGAPRIGDGK